MSKRTIFVTFPTQREVRRVLEEEVGSLARLLYVEDVSSRERASVLREVEILLSFFLSAELSQGDLACLDSLVFLQSMLAGVDDIPFAALPQDVLICSNGGAWADPLAEHALGMALALGKLLFWNHSKLSKGEYDLTEKSFWFRNSVCGILGFGGIGKAIAALVRPMGMKIHAINRSGVSDVPVDFLGSLDDLEKVLRAADVLFVTIPLTRATKGLLGRRELAWMKDEAILVNVARGDIISEKALFEHMRDHPRFKVGIDTWWNEPGEGKRFRVNYPFFRFPHFLGSPHNANRVEGITPVAARFAAANIVRFLRGETPKGVVDREEYL
jgi:phosphoglycerate dehydrogenase-like enzyme